MRLNSLRSPTDQPLPSDAAPPTQPGLLKRILDPGFGFVVWATHFLGIYVPIAVGCAVAGTPFSGHHFLVRNIFVGATIVAVSLVVGHTIWRWSHRDRADDPRMLMKVTLWRNGIAIAAMLALLIPALERPLCR